MLRSIATCVALASAIILLLGCLTLPTLELTPTMSPTVILPTATETYTPKIVMLSGNVWVRNDEVMLKECCRTRIVSKLAV